MFNILIPTIFSNIHVGRSIFEDWLRWRWWFIHGRPKIRNLIFQLLNVWVRGWYRNSVLRDNLLNFGLRAIINMFHLHVNLQVNLRLLTIFCIQMRVLRRSMNKIRIVFINWPRLKNGNLTFFFSKSLLEFGLNPLSARCNGLIEQ